MKRVLLIALFCAPAFAVTLDGANPTFDEREAKLLPQCEAQGGCAVISRAELEAYIQALRESWETEIRAGFAQAVKQEAARVCKNTI
jgi:hypothetical protein